MSPEEDDDWRRRIIRFAETVTGTAQPALTAIAEDVLRQHGANLFRRSDATQAAFVLNEIQGQSFLLGVKKGIEMTLEALTIAAPKTEESEASKT